MNPLIQVFKDQVSPKIPELYYHSLAQQFIVHQSGGTLGTQKWIMMSESAARTHLGGAGVRTAKTKEEDMSPADKLLYDTRNSGDRTVSLFGPLAGYQKGFQTIGSFTALVDESPKIPKSIKGDWTDVRLILEGLFGRGPQLTHFLSWCKISREMQLAGIRRGIPALVFCGRKNCGKTFLQEQILTPFMGGRKIKSDRYLSGGTTFNGEWAGSEHLIVSDESTDTSTGARIKKGNVIKGIVADETQSVHAKNQQAVNLALLWRLTISVNDELENIMSLPIINDSMEDKITIYHVSKFQWPVFALTALEKDEFKLKIHSQIAAFCWFLDNEFIIPRELTVDKNGDPARFGINCYHSPDIMRYLEEVSAEFRMLELIRQCYFMAPTIGGGTRKSDMDTITMTADELESGLVSNDSPVGRSAQKLLSTGTRMKVYLSRLHKQYPEHVRPDRVANRRFWVLHNICDILDRETEGCE